MKKLLFVLFAVMAAMLVIGVTTALTRSGDVEPETADEGIADEGTAA
jgi:hypothetical protein